VVYRNDSSTEKPKGVVIEIFTGAGVSSGRD